MNPNVPEKKIRRILADNSLYKVVETEDGLRVVLTDDDGPLSVFANIQTSQLLHHRVAQLERDGAISPIEADVLDAALTAYRDDLFDALCGE